ncbi:hypothetical protein FLAV_01864 [Flavobacteriales bacterium]|nr:hypothetical protein [Flavobacteriales bacterium]CAG0982862.1 hypothetical protein FLAV_01864 [Flavobacteriales bacterium]
MNNKKSRQVVGFFSIIEHIIYLAGGKSTSLIT